MNSEQSIVVENSVDEGLIYRPKDSSKKVYINKLLSRHKKQKAKERIETLIFVCLACVLVVISGIIVSL
jgi:hypothetical protein|tara:strand:- start:31 stop:237 length:207 start_codon:yes stop_codon:yes gene_type:complete